MTWRVLIAEVKQETSTFNPMPTLYDEFRIYTGEDIFTAYRDTKTELAGAFDIFDEDGRIELVPTVAADCVSGGPIATPDLDRLLGEIEASVRLQSSIDAAYICLHGAMAGADEGDPEGRLLRNLREILGDIPLVASLDLHCVLTDRMVEHADILVPYHTYPHTDHYETGQRAARNLLGLLDGTSKPTVARVKLPMLVRGDELLTATGRFGEAIRMCQDVEATESGLAAGVIIGNAFTDVPALQSSVLVTTNDDAEAALEAAERIGKFMWENRELFQAKLTSLEESICQANETDGLVVFSDAADATASGASGDSNAILKGLLASGFLKRALIPIVDAPAAAAAFKAGVGATIDVSLGGTRDPGRFEPVAVTARVKSLHDGRFNYENGTIGNGDQTAVLIVGSMHILVTQRPVYVVGQRVFQDHGLNPADYDLVVVKSPNGFRTWYESIASLIVPVDVPGSTSANLKSLPFRNCVRPIFPLNEDVPSPF
ncbi:MAG: M81 family metallopeptidase [Planctomycetota bacterium]|nr:M81 family metallopeptidase [Planctomycetota bacterium]